MAVSCEKKEEPKPDVESISIAQSEIIMAPGETATVKVSIAPEGTYSGSFTFTIGGFQYEIQEGLTEKPTSYNDLFKTSFDVATQTITITVSDKLTSGYEEIGLLYKQSGFAGVESNLLKINVPAVKK